MLEPKKTLFDGIDDFLDDVQAEYEKTEEFQAMRQRVNEKYARACELATGNAELLTAIRESEDAIIDLLASREIQSIKALTKEIYR